MKFFLLFFLFLTCSNSQAEGLSDKHIADDVRLSKKITVIGYRLYLGEVLEQLSRQSNVSITADTAYSFPNERVNICFIKVPLSEAINAIHSLMSFKEADYNIIVEKKDIYTYRFCGNSKTEKFSILAQETANKLYQEDVLNRFRRSTEYQGKGSPEGISERAFEMYRFIESSIGEQGIRDVLDGKAITIDLNNTNNDKAVKYLDTEKKLFEKLNPGKKYNQPTQIEIRTGDYKLTKTFDVLLTKPFTHSDGKTYFMKEGAGFGGGYPIEKELQAFLKQQWKSPGDQDKLINEPSERSITEKSIVDLIKNNTYPQKIINDLKPIYLEQVFSHLVNICQSKNISFIGKFRSNLNSLSMKENFSSSEALLHEW